MVAVAVASLPGAFWRARCAVMLAAATASVGGRSPRCLLRWTGNAKVPRTLRVICVFGAMVKGLNPTSGGGSGGGGAMQGGTVPETSVGLAAVPAVFSGGGAGSLFVFVSRLGLVELRSPSRVGFVEVDVFKRSVSLRALL